MGLSPRVGEVAVRGGDKRGVGPFVRRCVPERGVQLPDSVLLERLYKCAPLRVVAVQAARAHLQTLGQQAHRERLVTAGLEQRQRRR